MAFEKEPPAERPEPEPTLLEVVEKAGRQIGTALVVGAAFIALAIYARPGPPRYQAFGAGAELVRIDTRSGAMIACGGGQCYNVHKMGEHIARQAPTLPSLPTPAAPAAVPAIPAPAAPAAPSAPTAPAAPAPR